MGRLLKAIATLGLTTMVVSLVIIINHIPAFSQDHSSDHHSSPSSSITAPSKLTAPSPNASQVETFVNQGLEKVQQQDYKEALKDFDNAINLNEDHPLAYSYRADIRNQLGDYQKAVEDYTVAKKQSPAFPYIYNQQGKAYEGLGNYKKAVEDYTQAIKLYPEDGIGYTNRGIAYHKLKETKKAMANFQKAIQMNHGQADAYFYRGNLYAELGNNQAAIKDYQTAKVFYAEQGKKDGYLKVSLQMRQIHEKI